jgi:uncharacterized protein YgiM (DUF1202 family)
MKLNCCLMLGALVAVSAAAQNPTNTLPAIPPPVVGSPVLLSVPAPERLVTPAVEKKTTAPAKKAVVKKKKTAIIKPAAKKAEKPAILSEAAATLQPGAAEIVVNHVNVRGQAGLKGEVITHVQKGDIVNVISQITLDKHKADEPAQWAKISLPTNVTVWVNSKFIDATTKTVTPKKLNLRGGPGENYSVVGVVEKGAAITESGTKGDWTKIEAPSTSYAFIAAMYLKQVSSGNVPVNPPPSSETPAPTPTTVAEVTPIIAQPPTTIAAGNEIPVTTPPPVVQPQIIIQTNIIVVTDTNVPPPPPRIVTHEGKVRSSVSIVAPTYFELFDPANGTAINYLFSNTTNLNLARYNGLTISVTGEEGLDERWQKTPVLTVQKIIVLSGTPTPAPAAKAAPAPTDAKANSNKHWYYLWLR